MRMGNAPPRPMRRSAGERCEDVPPDRPSSGVDANKPHAGDFAILLAPSSNRVYSGTAGKMMEAELEVFGGRLLDGSVEGVRVAEMGGVPYVLFRGSSLSLHDFRCLSNLSSLYALFSVSDGKLASIDLHPVDQYDDDLLTILKYPGKTNEHFTKLLLNVTIAATGFAESFQGKSLRVFDPMCGRGTTLNQAVMYGHDAHGIDVDKRDFEAYSVFIRRWLKSKFIKHNITKERIRRDGVLLGERETITFSADKQRFKAGDVQTLQYVRADTTQADKIYGKNAFDIIVGDAPYGIQHGAVQSSKRLARSPTELLREAVPVWAQLLRPGGALGLAWNVHLTTFDELAEILTHAGLHVEHKAPFRSFRHRVDQAIDRDIIVARRLLDRAAQEKS